MDKRMIRVEKSRSYAHLKMELGESRGMGQRGKSPGKWYRRQLTKRERRIGKMLCGR